MLFLVLFLIWRQTEGRALLFAAFMISSFVDHVSPLTLFERKGLVTGFQFLCAGAMIAFGLGNALLKRNRIGVKLDPFIVCFLLYSSIFLCYTIFYEDRSDGAITKTRSFFLRSVVPVIAVYIFGFVRRSYLLVGIISCTVIGAVLGTLKLGSYGSVDSFRETASVSGLNPIVLPRCIGAGAVCAIVLAFATKIDHRFPKLLRITCLACIALGMFGVLVSGTKQAFLGVLLSGVLVTITNKKWIENAGLFIALGVTAIPALFAVGSIKFEASGLSRVLDFMTGQGGMESSHGRLDLFRSSLEFANSKSFLGGGTGSFGQYYENDMHSGAYSHNLFLEVLTEHGFAAVLLVLAAAITVSRRAIVILRTPNISKYAVCIVALWFYFLFVSQVSCHLGLNYAVWVAGAIVMQVSRTNRQEQELLLN